MAVLNILCVDRPSPSDHALQKLALFWGVTAQFTVLGGDIGGLPEAFMNAAKDGTVALGFGALRKLIQTKWLEWLLERVRFLFVYDFGPGQGELPELKVLTGGVLSSVFSVEAAQQRFTISTTRGLANSAVTGKSYTVENCPVAVFGGNGGGNHGGIETCISTNEHPVFVLVTRRHSTIFLLAGCELVDLDRVLTPEAPLRNWYAQLIATSMFLRNAFGDSCWSSPVTPATFIVDDPSLKARYGFVHYQSLVEELEKTQSALTIGFIPFNHRRSDASTIELVRDHSERLSIAVHGCDHTKGEFASRDEQWLTGTAARALERMEAHACSNRLPFDDVMIFPQGLFSTAAIRALKTCRFTAAVNTTPWPVNHLENPLTLRDLLDVAVTRYESFPIFGRRYPRDLFDYAFDALFQKPLLVVEHHDYFRHGYEPMGKVVESFSTLSERVKWMPLGKAVASTCVLKRTGAGRFTVRHFTPELRLVNPEKAKVSLLLQKPQQDFDVEDVLINDKKVPFEIQSNVLMYAAELQMGEELRVRVIHKQRPLLSRQSSWKHRFVAATRRMLSDARDNHLARHQRVLSLAVRLKNICKGGKRKA